MLCIIEQPCISTDAPEVSVLRMYDTGAHLICLHKSMGSIYKQDISLISHEDASQAVTPPRH